MSDKKKELYVSLTSYPARIDSVHITIESLLAQSHKADAVLLWLAVEQFPNKEDDLPEQLLTLCNQGLRIEWSRNIKSFTKLIPALIKYPEAIIVTADDDIIYPQNWLQLLYEGYLEKPNCINCHRAFRIMTSNEEIISYNAWYKGINIPRKGNLGSKSSDVSIGYRNFFTGCSGVLYPPHILHNDVLREDLFKVLAPTEDDVWFWAMSVHNNVPIHVVKGNLGLLVLNPFSNQQHSLYNTNSQNDTTNKIFKNIFNHYPDIKEKILNEVSLIVSLTSTPEHIDTVHLTIDTILCQSLRADKVILWLSPEQFPNKEADLPQQLLDLRSKGLSIDWYWDIKSYKKLIPSLHQYPEAIIVTAEDDVLYDKDWLRLLYSAHKKDGKHILCHRMTRLFYEDEQFKVLDSKTYTGTNGHYFSSLCQPSIFNKMEGVGGVLYPPHSLSADVLDEGLMMKFPPIDDDVWFWLQGIRNGYTVKVVENNISIVNRTPHEEAEHLPDSDDNGGFLELFYNIIDYYDELKAVFYQESDTNTKLITSIPSMSATSLYEKIAECAKDQEAYRKEIKDKIISQEQKTAEAYAQALSETKEKIERLQEENKRIAEVHAKSQLEAKEKIEKLQEENKRIAEVHAKNQLEAKEKIEKLQEENKRIAELHAKSQLETKEKIEELQEAISKAAMEYTKTLNEANERIATLQKIHTEETRKNSLVFAKAQEAQAKAQSENIELRKALQANKDFSANMLREVTLLPHTKLNLLRCRLLQHVTFGKRRMHYKMKKWALRARVINVRRFLKAK